MTNLETAIDTYLIFCESQKRLNQKTLRAYGIDLKQFAQQTTFSNILDITTDVLEKYIATLHQSYKPKTVKRKLASLKAFFRYLEYKNYIEITPFNKIQVKFREPTLLPKIIPLHTIEILLTKMYEQRNHAKTIYQRRNALRDIVVIELLFATGIRISELCSLQIENVNLYDKSILICGKGAKERCIHIGNHDVYSILNEYYNEYRNEIEHCGHFFVNQSGTPLSDQAVRRMIRKYASLASIDLHITPHMFRHTFATSLLEADVDIRYIQEMLGHSSINITEIYTHVALSKQRDILSTKHPRGNFNII